MGVLTQRCVCTYTCRRRARLPAYIHVASRVHALICGSWQLARNDGRQIEGPGSLSAKGAVAWRCPSRLAGMGGALRKRPVPTPASVHRGHGRRGLEHALEELDTPAFGGVGGAHVKGEHVGA